MLYLLDNCFIIKKLIFIMNLLKKSFIGISVLFVFLLGLTLIPTEKVDAAITVTVKANGQSSLAVPYGNNSVEISWTSTGATSCSESGGRGGTGITGRFTLTNMTATTTFTVNCSSPGYCSGTTSVPMCYGTIVGGAYNGRICYDYFFTPYIMNMTPSQIQAACGPNTDHSGCHFVPSSVYDCANLTAIALQTSDPNRCTFYSGCTWHP